MGSSSVADSWEAAFAMAEGHEAETLDGASSRNGDPLADPRTPKRRRRSKSCNSKSSGSASIQPDFFLNYLHQRSSSDVFWPSWLSLGEGLTSTRCSFWDNNSGTAPRQGDRCRRCGLSSSHHLTSVTEDVLRQMGNNRKSSGSFSASVLCPLPLFCVLRNLRCAARQAAVSKGFQLSSRTLSRLQRDWNTSLKRLLNPSHTLSERLANACHTVAPLLNTFLERPPNPDMTLHESAVRLITACDEVYFQLYYSQITRELPVPAITSTKTDFLVPHPLSFFGLIAVDMEHDVQTVKLGMETALSSADSNVRRRLAHQFGLFNNCESQLVEPTLSLLHQYRLKETFSLFQGSAASLRSETLSQLRGVKGSHETPAPRILMAWRDHCRDFLCHLYSYATLSRSVLDRLAETLVDSNVQNILELGAGNGYLAHVLAQSLTTKIDVLAYDLQPPDIGKPSNEYHGNTPTYAPVHRGTEAILRSHGGNLSRSALLLCYPSPRAPFAHQALKMFTERHGRILAFIGEFKGLTGSDAFERFLVDRYDCVLRLPTLCWGTDASFVSVWKRRSKQSGNWTRALLLPCTFCGSSESTKRCRLLRSLTYCSKICFLKDEEALLAALQVIMIDLSKGQLDFNCPHHFSDL